MGEADAADHRDLAVHDTNFQHSGTIGSRTVKPAAQSHDGALLVDPRPDHYVGRSNGSS